ncbi:MAG: TolB family protein [Mariniphaga sp.]
MKKLLLSFCFAALVLNTLAQYFQTGQDPASIRWKQIDSRNFKLIFPDYYEAQAKKLAGNLDAAYPFTSYTLKHNPQKIPFILHTQTVQSNGLVAWAPKRAEFYTTPHQSMYPQDWLEQLTLHEFRHVVQVDKIRSNLPVWARYLLGEQGTALVFGAYLPWWFIEGDAVVTETSLSNYGRGRLPSFLMEHQAQVVQKGVFSYEKAFFRSFRDYVPNHYKLGYYLTGNIRARYGSEIWEEVLTKAGSKPFSIFPMNQVLKKRTGMNTVQNYHSVFDSLKSIWVQEDLLYQSIPVQQINEQPYFFTSYRHNHWLNDSTILSYKTAYDEIPSFVKIQVGSNRETRVFHPGAIFNESVGYRDEWIVWAEQISDVRWEHSGRSLIRLYNVNTKKKIEINPEFKSFSPSVSPDKMKIAVVETDFSNNYYISVYQMPDGKLLQRYQSPRNNYFFTPEWLNNEEVVAVMLTEKGKQIVRINLISKELEQLANSEMGEIKHLRPAGEYLYFISAYSGKNSLYRLNLEDNSVERIYEPRFGVESPAVSDNGSQIILSDYTAGGFRLVELSSANDSVKELQQVKPAKYLLAEILARQEDGFPVFTDTVSGNYTVKNYSKAGNLFNFHSWAPASVDVDAYEFYPGVTLMSQNVLSTSEAVVGYKWDYTERAGRFVADYSFKGWFPVFDFDFSYGQRASQYNLIRQVTDQQGVVNQDTVQQRFNWRETTAGVTAGLPLTFDKGPFYRIIQPEIQYGFNHIRHQESTPHQFREGSFHSLSYRLYLQQVLRKSYLDMYPDFGVAVDGVYRHSPAGAVRAGNIKALQTIIYLPALMKNHGIKLYAGGQQKENGQILGFNDVVRYARGWGRIATTEIYTGGFDYKMPLIYPDWNFWGLLYTRRINAALFADYTRLKGEYYKNGTFTGMLSTDISSVGTEITADVNILRFYAPVNIGFRSSYLPEKKNVYFDILFSVNFTSF